MQEYLDFALEIADYAKEEMLSSFHSSKDYSFKDDKTIVTNIDRKINHYLIEKVSSKYPNHSVFGEEESTFNGKKYVWVCDPIDGTSMFQAEVPVCVFSLALVIDGIVEVGVVVDPFLNQTYSAIRGKGAFCNGKKIHVNTIKFGDLEYRLNYEMWSSSAYQTMGFAMKHLDDIKVSSIGSVARSCMAIASGKFSCDLFPGEEHGNCDIAASSLIIEEAGGKDTNFFAEKDRMDQSIHGAVLSNGVSHQQILELIRNDKDFFIHK